MANLFWAGPKAKREEISAHLMEKVSEHREPGSYAVRFDEGEAQVWIEIEDPNNNTATLWDILGSQPKIMGWRVLLFRCPPGFLGSGIKQFFAYEEKSEIGE